MDSIVRIGKILLVVASLSVMSTGLYCHSKNEVVADSVSRAETDSLEYVLADSIAGPAIELPPATQHDVHVVRQGAPLHPLNGWQQKIN